ncbi:C-type mannose receptor 2-like isoform X1 [Athalia rosae]|uniref:C-type mannose receptor 2-like isoform X1 n=1 Tax=Athalia rosae TaxID=37344 RepID=UPI002033D438|nr:C-type mannose receptor 2-like isoform X1 [Athalia rosae]
MAFAMASLPLHLLCQLIAPNVTTNHNNHGTPVNQLQQQPSAILPEGYVEYPGQGVAYKYHMEDLVSWKKARELCVSEGAHLAVIDTREKFEYVMRSHPGDAFHVGLYAPYDDNDDWVSVTSGGAPILNLPWQSTEPDSTYRCAVAIKDGLSNYSCSLSLWYFICERPISSSVPAGPRTTVNVADIH